MDIHYRIQGGVPLQGEVEISGSKNAALPLIAGSILCSGETILHNVPWLRDTMKMLEILEFLGAETSYKDGTARINTANLQPKAIPREYVSKLRGSIVLLGPLLARFGVVEMAYPGGCVLGKRPVGAHITALTQLGAEDMSTGDTLHLQGKLKSGHVILPEFSVTATENVVMAAALLEGETRIDLAAGEPHVQQVELMVQQMGAEVEGIGTHSVTIRGRKHLQCAEFTVTSDYLEAGALTIAGLITGGKLTLQNVERHHLLSFFQILTKMGAELQYNEETKELLVDGESSNLSAGEIRTNIFPGYPTDLQAPMGVLMSQSNGVSRIFERLFEGRMAYLFELEKMGAHIEVMNSHQALVIGPTPLKGQIVASNDIRAGVSMVLAALCATGESTVTDVRYIERGYSRLEEKLRSLGAQIEKIEIED